MKTYALILIVTVCAAELAYTDWRNDMKKEHVNRLLGYTQGMKILLRSSAAMKNTTAAWECYNTASKQFDDLIDRHSSHIDQCITSAAEKFEAAQCCDELKKKMIKDATNVSSIGYKCIDHAS